MDTKTLIHPNPEKTFFTSDTHFSHEKIIEYNSRPFTDVTEMDSELIRRWNSVVPEDGVVYHLGDFCFGDFRNWEKIISQLNGSIILIRGNHDFKINQQNQDQLEKLFSYVNLALRITIESKQIWLSHFPYLCFSGSERGSLNLFGHVHSGPNSHGLDLPRLQYLFPHQQYDVGVDNNNYTPISWSQIKEKLGIQ